MSKTFNSRIQLKTDTKANWEKATNFIPKLGEVCVYIDYLETTNDNGENVYIPGMKIGDGIKYINELEFVNDDYITNVDIDEIISNTQEEQTSIETCVLTFPDYSKDEYEQIIDMLSLTPGNSQFYYSTLNNNEIVRLSYNLYDLFLNSNYPIGCASRTITVVKGTSISIYGNWFRNTFVSHPNDVLFYSELINSQSPIYSYTVKKNVDFIYDGPI